MPRNITVTFADGTSHVYQNAPDNLTPDMVEERASKDFGKTVKSLDGGSSPTVTPAPAPQGTGSKVLDTGNAIGTGFQKGLLRLAGLPVDTVANVRDLLKAGAGTVYQAATGKTAPDFLQIGDRSNDIGSGDNLIKNAQKTSIGRTLTDPVNPDYRGGYSEAVGGGLTGVVNPVSARQAINQALLSVGGAVAGKGVYDATGSNALAIAAGMSPTAGQSAAIDATKYAIRGGEKGRIAMAQRLEDLKNAGIDNPSMGLASGNGFVGGLENLLQQTPGAVGTMGASRDAAVNGLQAKLAEAAAKSSTNRGTVAAGTSIQTGAKNFKDAVRDATNAQYDNLSTVIPNDFPVEVGNTRTALANLNADIPTMEALSRQFKNGRIQAIEGALNSDMKGTPSVKTVINVPQQVVVGTDAGGMPKYQTIDYPVYSQTPEIPPRTAIPFEAVKKTRTLVGNELNDNSLIADVPRSKWNPLYGALSEDMQAGATAAGPAAEAALNRANNYTRSSIGRLEKIAPVIDRPTPEGSFKALESTLRDTPTLFQAVKKSLPEGARGDFAGTVIDRLGVAKAGQQDATGGKWSPDTFLTNWNNMSPAARTELLSGFPNAAQVAADVENVAKATALMRQNSKMYANPSGTGANLLARGTLGAIGGGGVLAAMGMGSPMVPLAAAGGVLGANVLARALTSGNNVKSIASKSYIDPQILQSQINQLVGTDRIR
jgi:hypothetical protein